MLRLIDGFGDRPASRHIRPPHGKCGAAFSLGAYTTLYMIESAEGKERKREDDFMHTSAGRL